MKLENIINKKLEEVYAEAGIKDGNYVAKFITLLDNIEIPTYKLMSNLSEEPIISESTKTALLKFAEHYFRGFTASTQDSSISPELDSNEKKIIAILGDDEITSKSDKFEEIKNALSLTSEKAVYSELNKLEQKGLIVKESKLNASTNKKLTHYRVAPTKNDTEEEYIKEIARISQTPSEVTDEDLKKNPKNKLAANTTINEAEFEQEANNFLDILYNSFNLRLDCLKRIEKASKSWKEDDIEVIDYNLIDKAVMPFFEEAYKKNKFPKLLQIPFIVVPDIEETRTLLFLEAEFYQALGISKEDAESNHITLTKPFLERLSSDLLEIGNWTEEDVWVMKTFKKFKENWR